MDFEERINLHNANYLWKLPKKIITDILNRKYIGCDDTVEVKYGKFRKYLKEVIESKGVNRRVYKYSDNTDHVIGGRFYSPHGIQGLQREFRGLLMPHTTDIDMANAHPTILRYICKQKGILCPSLDCYVNNRDTILGTYESREKGKELHLRSMNDNKKLRTSNQQLKQYDAEMKMIQQHFLNDPEYQVACELIPREQKEKNERGSLLNRVLCSYENKILQNITSYLNHEGYDIAVLMFDGLLIYGDHYANTELLNRLAEITEAKFPGLGMRYTYKSHYAEMDIPPPPTTPEEIPESIYESYTIDTPLHMLNRVTDREKAVAIVNRQIHRTFEETHCKILTGMYIHHPDQSTKTVLSPATLKASYAHMACLSIFMGTITHTSFIEKWVNVNKDIRAYATMGIYPDSSKCPLTAFNLWTPFSAELLPTPPPSTTPHASVTSMRKHILILCGNNETVAQYMECWIAQMIQMPDMKTNCPILISKEGAGKGTLMKMLMKLLGTSKCMETSTPSRDVWGTFNGRMRDSFLVNLNELSQKETTDSMGQIKALITDASMNINEKGVSQYPITSYHRFIITTNNPDPISTKEDDRRFWIIRSSDELIGNKAYFTDFNAMLDDPVAIAYIYTYFKELVGFGDYTVTKFNEIPKPTTDYQRNIQVANTDVVLQWVIHLASTNTSNTLELSGTEAYQRYSTWQQVNGIEYKTNALKLGKSLSNISVDLIQKGRHTRDGKTKIYNLQKIRELYGIEIDTTDPETEHLDCDEDDEPVVTIPIPSPSKRGKDKIVQTSKINTFLVPVAPDGREHA